MRLPWIVGQVLSFETAFALFFFSNQIETLLGTDLNLTIPTFGLSVMAGAVVLSREGINLRNMVSLAAGLLFVFWCLASYAWTPSRLYAPVKAVPLAIFVVWILIGSSLIIGRSRERVTRLFVLMLGIAGLLTLKGLWIQLVFGGFRQVRSEVWDEADAASRIYLAWGRGVGPGAVLAFLMAVYARPFSLRQVVAAAFFAATTYFLLVSGGRGPFLAVGVACFVPFLLGIPMPRGRLLLPRSQLITLLLVAAAALGLAFLIANGSGVDTLKRLGSLIKQMGDDDKISIGTDRFDKYARAWQGWSTAPVFGHGIGSFPIVSLGRESKQGDYPHNIILEVLFEFGLVGLCFFGFYLWVSLRSLSVTRLRADPLLLGSLMIFANAMFNAMVSAEITSNTAVYLGAGLLLVPWRASDGSQAAGRAERARKPPPARAANPARLA